MVQVSELWHWQYHYYSLADWWGMKLCLTVVGQAQWGGWVPTCDSVHHDDFIALPHWNTWPRHSVVLSSQWVYQSLPYPEHAKDQARERQVSILKSFLDSTRIRKCEFHIWNCDLRIPRSPITEGGRSYSFSHSDWLSRLHCCDIYYVKKQKNGRGCRIGWDWASHEGDREFDLNQCLIKLILVAS